MNFVASSEPASAEPSTPNNCLTMIMMSATEPALHYMRVFRHHLPAEATTQCLIFTEELRLLQGIELNSSVRIQWLVDLTSNNIRFVVPRC